MNDSPQFPFFGLFCLVVYSLSLPVCGQLTKLGVDPNKLFETLDRNNSGFLERPELGRRGNLIDKLDSNQDGRLSLKELLPLQKQAQELRKKNNKRSADSDPIEILGTFDPELPFDVESCRRAAQYSVDSNGKSLLVMHNGKIIYEHYHAEGSPETGWELASGTKSFSGVLAMLLVQDRLITLDEKISDTITEWKNDGRKSQITVNQLLHLTSGLKPDLYGPLVSPTWKEAITAPAEREPGTTFDYGPVPFQCFGEFVERKLASRKQGPLEYLDQKVFKPIGLKYSTWRKDSDGKPTLPAGASLTAREWAKFGEFIRLGGTWKGKAILRTELLDQCFVGSPQNPGYGLTFWLGKHRGLGADAGIAARLNRSEDLSNDQAISNDLIMANGLGGQRMFISRKAKLVVIRQTDAAAVVLRRVDDSNWSDREFLKLLLTKKNDEDD